MIFLLIVFVVLIVIPALSTTTTITAISILMTAVMSVLALALTATTFFLHVTVIAPQAGEPASTTVVSTLVIAVVAPYTTMVVTLSTSLFNEITRLRDLNINVWSGNG